MYIIVCKSVENIKISYLSTTNIDNLLVELIGPTGNFIISIRAPTTLKSEGEVTSHSGADKREVRDNREKSKYFSNCTTFHK
jgi:hypothetical protein